MTRGDGVIRGSRGLLEVTGGYKGLQKNFSLTRTFPGTFFLVYFA